MNINTFYKYLKLFSIIPFLIIFSNCAKAPANKIPVSGDKRIQKNIEEGRGFRLFGGEGSGGTNYEFATSNPMWRATIELLDFAPFSNVDYSGGIIVTDWFADEEKENEAIKITVKFLSNEVRADGLELIIHKKFCNERLICKTKKIESILTQEIKLAILKKAATLKQIDTSKKPRRKKNIPERGF